MAKVIKLRVENILGIKSAEAEPNGESVVIGGANGQGKSSLQRALKMALGGKEHVSAEPTHGGADKGTVFTALDNGYTVEFTVTKDRKTRLLIKNLNNPGFKSDSVSLLKDLFGDLSFDPGACMSKGPKELAEALMRLAGLDFSELNLARAESFERRTAVGRDEKRLAAQLKGFREHGDVPASEVSAKAILDELQAAQKLLADETSRQSSIAALEAGLNRTGSLIVDIDRQVEQLRARRSELVAQQGQNANKL